MSGQVQRSPLNVSLRELRKQRGWTQAEVAEALGVTDLTVRRWELGQTTPSVYHVKKLCDLFEKSPEELGLLQQRQSVCACGKVLAAPSPYLEAEPGRSILQRQVPEKEKFVGGETESSKPSPILAVHAPDQICLMAFGVFVQSFVFVALLCLSLADGLLLALQAVTPRVRKRLLGGSQLLSQRR